jgi:hypothetical protein
MPVQPEWLVDFKTQADISQYVHFPPGTRMIRIMR